MGGNDLRRIVATAGIMLLAVTAKWLPAASPHSSPPKCPPCAVPMTNEELDAIALISSTLVSCGDATCANIGWTVMA